jgi:hypothetical protein
LDLISADVDGFTELGGITSGSSVYFPQDKFWTNTIAYMDKLETTASPIITVSGNNLSVADNYVSYQWYLNGEIIPGAQSSTYTASGDGEYTVEVTYKCGCVVKAPAVDIVTPVNECSLECNNLLIAMAGSLQFTNLEKKTELAIYNDIGQQLFYSSDYQNNWMPPAAGIYLYKVRCPGGIKKEGKVIAVL